MSKTLPILLILCGLSFAQSPNPQVTGTLTYRERMALPADAMIQVQLLDVSKADAPSKTVAESMLNAEGRQVPIPFTLSYDPAEIIPAHRYSVRATIRSADGMLMFSTSQSYPVITNGAPSKVNLVLYKVGRGPKPGAAAAKPPAPSPTTTSNAVQPSHENEPPKPVAETTPNPAETPAVTPAGNSESASAKTAPETASSAPPSQEPSAASASQAQDQAPAAQPPANSIESPPTTPPSETAAQTAAVAAEPQALSTPSGAKATPTEAKGESKSEPPAEPAQKVQSEASQPSATAAESQVSAGERDLTGADSTPPAQDAAAAPKPAPDSAGTEPAPPAKPAEPEPALPEAPSAVARLSPPAPDSSSAGPEGGAAPPEGESTPDSSSRPERASVSTPLADTQWRLIQLGTENIVITPPDRPMTLAFSPEGKRIAGSAGCNSYIGTFHDDNGHLALNPGNMTLMGCGDKAMARQQKFVAALRDADGFRISGNYLVLTSKGKMIARFINQFTQ